MQMVSFEGKTFKSKIIMTIVNGTIVYNEDHSMRIIVEKG
jgi:dihydroorotase-like cyclic amidohydrolase